MEMVYGLYDEVLHTSRYAALAANDLIDIDTATIDDADLPHIIGSLIGREYTRAFASMKKEDVIAAANRALAHLDDEDRGGLEQKLLTEIRPAHQARLVRPTTPLSEVALLTNSAGDPQLSSELAKEIASADRIDLICSFIKHSGMRLLDEALAGAAHRRVPIRVLTTTYMGATEEKALENLVRRYGAEVKINYDASATPPARQGMAVLSEHGVRYRIYRFVEYVTPGADRWAGVERPHFLHGHADATG